MTKNSTESKFTLCTCGFHDADTIRPVARPRGVLSEQTMRELELAKRERHFWEVTFRACVVKALDEGSFSAVAEATGLSKDTLQRWKREAGE